MKEEKGKKLLLVVLVYVVLITAAALSWKFIFAPRREKKIIDETGSSSRYKHVVKLALDSFSGYSILRCPEFHKDLKAQGINMVISDDNADYRARIKALRDGDIQMAVFTVDSLIKSGAEIKEFPATIVLVIDESRGADAIIAYKQGVENLQDLDDPKARFVLTPSSPSEFLARVVVADLNLVNLPEKWWKDSEGAMAVRKEFRVADPKEKTAYVLWEPALSLALKEPDAHILLDSSQLKGFILDVLVAQRKYLLEHHDVVKAVVEAYLRTVYHYNHRTDGFQELVLEDSRLEGMQKLDKAQTEKLVQGIQWKNTLENYAHFGLLSPGESRGLSHIEDSINKITQVLVTTQGLEQEPFSGDPGILFYNKIIKELQAEGFHPGKKLNILKDSAVGALDIGKIRVEKNLPPLTDEQWMGLQEIGELRIQPILFARGTDRINIQSRRHLNKLSQRLKSWPRAYLRVIGHTRSEGDLAANRRLAYKRAFTVRDYLLSKGINENRIRAEAAAEAGKGGSAQSVSFILGYVPY